MFTKIMLVFPVDEKIFKAFEVKNKKGEIKIRRIL